jgi:RNA polymerase sigma factor (sigma-70 family)
MVEMAGDDGSWVEPSVAATGWPEGFIDLYRSQWEPMVRLARLMTAGDPAAEELVQDSFLRVKSKWGAIDSPAGYLRVAVVNACHNHHRHRRVEHRPTPGGVETDVDRFELRVAIAALPVRQRSAMVLRYYEDMPETEIAVVLGCSVSAVKSLLHRGLQDLRKVIDR